MLPHKNAETWKWKHNEIRAKRSLEAGIWLISSDVTGERDDCISYGPTVLINPQGVVVNQVPLMSEGLLIQEIAPGF
jgi:predicted amidohydrolase